MLESIFVGVEYSKSHEFGGLIRITMVASLSQRNIFGLLPHPAFQSLLYPVEFGT